MKLVLSAAALLLTASVSIAAHAAPADELGGRLDHVCTSAIAPDVDGLTLDQHGRDVETYAAAVAAYQECLRHELQTKRAHLTQSEQALIAGRLSRSSYDVREVRLAYASAVRDARTAAAQVAERP